jgi:hypothetical protein
MKTIDDGFVDLGADIADIPLGNPHSVHDMSFKTAREAASVTDEDLDDDYEAI